TELTSRWSSMSRSRKYIGGLAGHYLNQAILLLVGLWLTRLLLAEVGQHDYGLWLMVLQVLSFLELTDLGIVALLPREVAYRTGSEKAAVARAESVRDLLDEVRRITLWQMPFVAMAA